MLCEFQHPGHVEVNHPSEIGELGFEKRLAAGVGTGVVDQQADLHASGLGSDSRNCLGIKQIHGYRANLATDLTALPSGVVERARLAGDPHEIDAATRQLLGEFGSDPFGTGGDHRPRSMLRHIDHGGHCYRWVALVSDPSADDVQP